MPSDPDGVRLARRTVDVLGGMGPAASAHFCLRLAEVTAAWRDQDHLRVMDSDPSVPDRTAFLLGRRADPAPSLIAMAGRLVRAGADLLVLACNSASPFTGRVVAAVLDWAGEAVGALLDQVGSSSSVGVLCTDGTAWAGLRQRRLQAHHVAALLADEAAQATVIGAIYDIKAGAAGLTDRREQVLQVARGLAARGLAARGASALLIACTELSLLFRNGADWPVPATDATDAVAARTVVRAGGRLRAQDLACRPLA